MADPGFYEGKALNSAGSMFGVVYALLFIGHAILSLRELLSGRLPTRPR